jgi:hypothetical protein
MAFAVVAGNTPYFLTRSGMFFMSDHAWSGNKPAPGSKVTARGTVSEHYDVNECRFLTMELESPGSVS